MSLAIDIQELSILFEGVRQRYWDTVSDEELCKVFLDDTTSGSKRYWIIQVAKKRGWELTSQEARKRLGIPEPPKPIQKMRRCPNCHKEWEVDSFYSCPNCDWGREDAESKREQQHTFFKYGGGRY